MLIQLKQLFSITGEKKDFSFEIPISDAKEYASIPMSTPITVYGTLVNRAGVVTLNYTVSVTLSSICDRCSINYKRKFEYDYKHIIVQEVHNDNDEYIVCEDGKIDLRELAVLDLLLSLPSKNLCIDDCKGLCISCGADLNQASCSCEVTD